MTEAEGMRDSIMEIKSQLGNGQMVCRARQTGKTTALFEFAHENGPGTINIITFDFKSTDFLRMGYKKMYPLDPQPTFISQHAVRDSDMLGTNRRWATDELWPSSVIKKAPFYQFASFLGGVGTPYCMDMHSK